MLLYALKSQNQLMFPQKTITLFEKDQKSYSKFVNELKYRNYGTMTVYKHLLKKDCNTTRTAALWISTHFRESMKPIVGVLQVDKCTENEQTALKILEVTLQFLHFF